MSTIVSKPQKLFIKQETKVYRCKNSQCLRQWQTIENTKPLVCPFCASIGTVEQVTDEQTKKRIHNQQEGIECA